MECNKNTTENDCIKDFIVLNLFERLKKLDKTIEYLRKEIHELQKNKADK